MSLTWTLRMNWIVWHAFAVALHALLWVLLYFTIGSYGNIPNVPFRIPFDLILMIPVLIYSALSFVKVDINEGAVISIFGWYLFEFGGGPVYVPYWIATLRITDFGLLQQEVPDDPEKIYHGDGPVAPQGFVPPIRITFSGIEDDRDPLNRRVTADEVIGLLKLKAEKGRLREFFIQYGGDLSEAMRQAKDTIVGGMSEILPRMTVGQALQRLGSPYQEPGEATAKTINDRLRERVEARVSPGGVEVDTAQIKAINFNHSLNSAIQAPARELGNAEGARIIGKGRGDAIRNESVGQVEAVKSLAGIQHKARDYVLGLIFAREIAQNTAEQLGKGTNINVGAEGLAVPASVGAALLKALPKPSPSNPQGQEG